MISVGGLRVLPAIAIALAATVGGGTASAVEPAPTPALLISSVATPTNFSPHAAAKNSYEVRVDNVGGAATDGSPITIVDTLPAGLSVARTEFVLRYKHEKIDFGENPAVCKVEKPVEVATVTCTVPAELAGSGEESSVLAPAEELRLTIFVSLPSTVSEGFALTNRVTVEGGGAPAASATAENEVNAANAPAGVAEYRTMVLGPDGKPATQAGSHPYQLITTFSLNTKPALPGSEAEVVPSGGDPKDMPVLLPPGLIGSPTATARCTLQQFNTVHLVQPFPANPEIQLQQNECPDGSAVGYVTLRRMVAADTNALPLYSLVPPPGMPAQFGINVSGLPIFIDTEVRPEQGYRIVGVAHNISEAKRLVAAVVTFWGNPADPRHDPIRGNCLNSVVEYPNSIAKCHAGIVSKPFLRLPTSCAGPLDFRMSLDTWTDPGQFSSATSSSPAPVGCNLLDFEPMLEVRATTRVADSPSGLEIDLRIPQNDDPGGLGEADARRISVTFPPGMVVNPSGANGLGTCSRAQVGLLDGSPIRFSDEAAGCPDSSRIGTVEVDTPLLDEPLHGGLYVAAPRDNPFGSLLAVYFAVDDPERGIVVKLAGRVEPDPRTGQLTTVFDENPQMPFSALRVRLFSGALAPLRTPVVCGAYGTTSVMTPWSAPDSGPPATPSSGLAIDEAPSGACAFSEDALPNAPSFNAGMVNPQAGAYSPLVVNLRREDGSQEFGSLTVAPPPGLVAKLAGVPYCPESALVAAAARTGSAEKADPSCPSASQVGTVEVGAGAGPSPYYVPGKAYLTGPYKGAPLGLAVVTPAVAGPFDLGTVVVRSALHVDPETTRITAKSDPLPSILEGVPLDLRSIAVRIDRPDFTLNPTGCRPRAVGGEVVSRAGRVASLSDRFQVGGCEALGFEPKLALRLKGGTRRTRHPALTATLTDPRGSNANLLRASVALPRSEFLEQSHIKTICTRVQFAAGQAPGERCPRGSIYGYARATTPLLDEPLQGPVYLRSSSHQLPDLVVALRGQVDVVLRGRIDTGPGGGIRTTFEGAPDAPVSRFTLTMQGGRKGLLVNSENICLVPQRAVVRLTAQNGAVKAFRPAIANECERP